MALQPALDQLQSDFVEVAENHRVDFTERELHKAAMACQTILQHELPADCVPVRKAMESTLELATKMITVFEGLNGGASS